MKWLWVSNWVFVGVLLELLFIYVGPIRFRSREVRWSFGLYSYRERKPEHFRHKGFRGRFAIGLCFN